MKQWMTAMVLLLVLSFPGIVRAEGSESEKMTDEMLSAYTEFYGDIFADGMDSLETGEAFLELLPDKEPKELLGKLVRGEVEVSLSNILQTLLRLLLKEVYSSLKVMVLIVALAVLCSYLTGLQDSFGKEGVGMTAFYVCYIVIAGIASASFYQAAECVGGTVEQIALFMKMIVPIVITSLVSCGALVSASVFEPVLVTIVELAVSLIQDLMIPLVMIATGMNIVNNLSDRFKTQKLVKFMNQTIKWGLSIMLTVFVSVAGLQSIATGGADALTVKLSKFATSNLIPVVGGILSESVETVMNCSVLIKNSVGIFGIICLIVLAVLPLLKVAAILIIFRLTAAVCEPVSEPKIITCLTELANSISVLFSMLAAVTVMFIIVLTIVINAGNTVMMLGR
ncbi:MAG: stage III sporulation protein AE [Clostridia bacterium]|nr:stage III sporulation protein AE [Clostridia bacterium]